MPYLYAQYHGEEAKRFAVEDRFGPKFDPDIAEDVERVDVICSSFDDPGPDWCQHRLFDARGHQIAARHVPGY